MHRLAALSSSLQLKDSQCLSWLREEMQKHRGSSTCGEARGVQGTRDKVGEAPPLVIKVPGLTKPPSSICNLFYLPPLTHSFACLPAMPICLNTPSQTSLAPVAYRGHRNTHRSHTPLIPGLTRTCLPILARV
jgi:hypothetical protein